MSIFAKTFNIFRHNVSESSQINEGSVDLKALSSDLTEYELGILSELIARPDGEEIDIPLHKNLTELHGVIKNPNEIPNDLDFDLTSNMGSKSLYPESQVLSINPFKTFSKQVDLDLDSLDKQGFINPDNIDTPLSSAFRMIKRPLLNNALGKGASVGKNANLIMVTSSLGGEGKTFSAINLAISIAMEKEKRVLLIDADVNKPSHHEVFGINMEYGLTDLLLGKTNDMSQVLCKANIPSLSLMFAGNYTALATELLASETMADFVKDISSRYPDRIIIFDSPPLLLTTESSVLASHMGQVVLVIEAEKTTRHDVSKSLSLLSNEIVLMLLNKMRQTKEAGNYGYYGYGHHS